MSATTTLLFFDVETTGLFARGADPSRPELFDQCRIVSIAWSVEDTKKRLLSRHYYIVDMPDFDTIPAEHIHGIAKAETVQHGVSVSGVLDHFMRDLARADAVVAHNLQFDVTVLLSELHRLGRSEDVSELNRTDKRCTMLMTTDTLKLPSAHKRRGYKWPTLQELHEYLFHEPFENSHHAAADVQALSDAFWEIARRG